MRREREEHTSTLAPTSSDMCSRRCLEDLRLLKSDTWAWPSLKVAGEVAVQ